MSDTVGPQGGILLVDDGDMSKYFAPTEAASTPVAFRTTPRSGAEADLHLDGDGGDEGDFATADNVADRYVEGL